MLIAVVALALTAKQMTGSITGRVIDALTGKPISGASVTLCRGRNVPKPKCESYQATTEQDGIFHIDGVPADIYDADASAAGHLSAEARVPCQVHAGETATMTIPLQPEAIISGRVVGADGAPISGAAVEALSQTGKRHFTVAARTQTNAEGGYTLKQLRSAAYVVAVERRNSATYFLPGVIDVDAAQSLQVSYGQESRGADIRLRSVPLHVITGKVEGMDALPPSLKLRLLLYSRSLQIDGAQPRTAQIQSDGHFQIRELSPGDYTLLLEAPRFGTRDQSNLSIQILEKNDISISDSDITNVTVSTLPLANVEGRIELDHPTPEELAKIQPGLTLTEPFHIYEFKKAVIAPDQSFSFSACQPARYELRLYSPPGLYVSEVDVNGHPVSSRVLDFSPGNSVTLTIRYERGAASLTGTLHGPRMAGVYLIPQDWHPDDWRDLRWGNVSANGTFSVPDLRPGHYSAVVVEKSYDDEDVRSLASRGVEIEIEPRQQKRIELDSSQQ